MFFDKNRVIPKIRLTEQQEENCEVIFVRMSSTENQEENGICGNQHQRQMCRFLETKRETE